MPFLQIDYCNFYNAEYNTGYTQNKESVKMSVDDYLDLLNYAKAINDGQWQADIIDRLNKLSKASHAETTEQSVNELWIQFDDINAILMDLFNKLRESVDPVEQYRWKEKIWELKQERINLSKKIQSRYIRI